MVFRDNFTSCVDCGVALEGAGLAALRFLACAMCGGAWVGHDVLTRMFAEMRWDARVQLWSADEYRAATSDAALHFIVSRGDTDVGSWGLDMPVVKIGRLASAHVRLEDDSVGRLHAVVEFDGPHAVQIIDLGATSGTYVNDVRVNKAPLADGDTVRIGVFTLRVSTRPGASRDAPPSRRLCLECSKPTTAMHVETINVDVCNDHGVWFDAFELEQVLRRIPT